MIENKNLTVKKNKIFILLIISLMELSFSTIKIDKENDLVVVTRWLEPNKIGAFMKKVNAAL